MQPAEDAQRDRHDGLCTSRTSSSGSKRSSASARPRREPGRHRSGRSARRSWASPTALLTRLRVYGGDRVPRTAASCSHTTTSRGSTSRRSAGRRRGPSTSWRRRRRTRVPVAGAYPAPFGSFAVRRGESDREAVRRMREVVRDGHALGIFAEGTRQRCGRARPGAAGRGDGGAAGGRARRLRRDLRLARPGGSATSSRSRSRTASRCASTACRAARKGYREASAEIEARAAPALGVAPRPARSAAGRGDAVPPARASRLVTRSSRLGVWADGRCAVRHGTAVAKSAHIRPISSTRSSTPGGATT